MIELQDVRKTHLRGTTEVHAVRGVTGEIPDGSFNFVLGPSGSGKSSLLYLIGALDAITAGEIVVDGRAVGAMTDADRDAYRRDEIGFIFQSFNLLRNLDAVGNVLVPFLPGGVSGELKTRGEDLLKRVGLGDRLRHVPNHLSGGEQQRVAIARALLKNPKYVLADEPTGELDTATGREIMTLLRDLHAERGATVVIVTHDESHLAAGDRVMRMRDGVLTEVAVV